MRYLGALLPATLAALYLAPAAAQAVQFAPTEVLQVGVVSGDGKPLSWQLLPASTAHTTLLTWLAGNQAGWTNYVATLPGKGLIVAGNAGRIQFLGRSAFVCPSGTGCLHKTVQPSDYEYLLQSRPK